MKCCKTYGAKLHDFEKPQGQCEIEYDHYHEPENERVETSLSPSVQSEPEAVASVGMLVVLRRASSRRCGRCLSRSNSPATASALRLTIHAV